MSKKSILLISPPVTKPCEPPAGIAKLTGYLRSHGIDCKAYDASIDCVLGLLDQPAKATDTWTKRANHHLGSNLEALRSSQLYTQRDRYKRTVMDVNRILAMAGRSHEVHLSLGNYASPHLSPVRSADLLMAAENHRNNPFFPIFSRALETLLDEWEPDIFGISINFMSQALCAFSMIGFLKNRCPGKQILCGGGLVTSWRAVLKTHNPFAGLVDELIAGPGEKRLLALCRAGTEEENDTPTPITGYDFTDTTLNRYLSPLPVLPYSASSGCYWKKCAFCPEKAENRPYRTARPFQLSRDLQRCVAGTSAGLIHFLDNALSPRLLQHFIENPPGVSWYGFARFSHHLANRDFARGLQRSGCAMLKLGVESGDQTVLDALEKGIELDLVSKALATLHEVGIATYVYLLFGTPAENEESAARTLKFTVANAANIDFLNLAIFNLPASGKDAQRLDTDEFYAGDLSLYRSFSHPLGWHRDRVRRFLAKRFRKPAAIRSILANDPPFFTSNHAPLFGLERPPELKG